jgi:hypothetical protein
MQYIPSIGIVRYTVEPIVGHKVILEIDEEIKRFYFNLIPRYLDIQPQKYRAHISVVRKEKTPINMNAWSRHEGKEIPFFYSPLQRHGEVYWWIDAFSAELEDMRMELGLPLDSRWHPPPGYRHTFHISLGNKKHQKKSA